MQTDSLDLKVELIVVGVLKNYILEKLYKLHEDLRLCGVDVRGYTYPIPTSFFDIPSHLLQVIHQELRKLGTFPTALGLDATIKRQVPDAVYAIITKGNDRIGVRTMCPQGTILISYPAFGYDWNNDAILGS